MTEVYCQYALPPGAMVQEFRIINVLGVGSFGIVYSAENKYFKETVAIKEFLPTELACRKEGTAVVPLSSETEETYRWALKRFLEEARILRQLADPVPHPNIVGVRQFIEANDTAYMVMDYEKGQPLSQILKERGPLQEQELRGYLESLLEGLERVHAEKVWHRDIKPSNILVRSDGSPVLIDFGAARRDIVGADRSVLSTFTPAYAAPEQVGPIGRQGPWTDIYALGATLYRVVTGNKPTNAAERMQGKACASAAQASEGGYSRTFLNAIDAALELKPDNRPQSIKEWRRLFDDTHEKTAKNNYDATVARMTHPWTPDIIPTPVDIESALAGLTESEVRIDSTGEDIKSISRPRGDKTSKKRIFQPLFSPWTVIVAIALMFLIVLLWIGLPKKDDRKVDVVAQEAMNAAREAALVARDEARNYDVDKLENYYQAQSHFDTGKAAVTEEKYRQAKLEFQDAQSLFKKAANEGSAIKARSKMEKARQSALKAGVQFDATAFDIATLNAELGEKRLANKEFEPAAESFTLAFQSFEQAVKGHPVSVKTLCDASVDPKEPVGVVCAYFQDCQNGDTESAVKKRTGLSPDSKKLLQSEIQNSDFYKIIDVTLLKKADSSAEVYTEYIYKRRGQKPISYVGSIFLEKNNFDQWEILDLPQTIKKD